MAEFPIMPVKVADLLADTVHMDAAEFGAYVRILFELWQHGGLLPERDLFKRSRCSPRKWALSRRVICAPLTIIDGVVSQKRLTDTRLKVREKRRKAAASAELGWNKRKGMRMPMRTHGTKACERNAIKISKKGRKNLPSSLTDSERAESQPAASDEASKGHPPRASESLRLRRLP